MKIRRLVPQKFSTRLIIMTLISGLTPMVIFFILVQTMATRFPEATRQAIVVGQQEQWRRSEKILSVMAEDFIRQKAEDVAVQMGLYLESHPALSLVRLIDDPNFRRIAIQPVGSGSTAVFNSANAVNVLHSDLKIQGLDIKTTAKAFPDHWSIIAASMNGRCARGYYQWKDPQGAIRKKFMFVAPLHLRTADGVHLNVAATTYIDEFFKPLFTAQEVSNETAVQLMGTVHQLIRSFRNKAFGIMLAGLLVIMGLSYWVGTYFSRAIQLLRQATRKINQGDLSTRIAPSASSGDVNELIHDFNQMVSHLAATTVKKEALAAQEEQLRRSNEQLQAEIGERRKAEAERQKMADQLQRAQKMQAVGALAGGVAHDLNNILSGLVSYPELLMLGLADKDPLKAKLSIIQRSGQKAADIVQDMLSLARKGTTAKTQLDLNAVVHECLESREVQQAKAGHPHCAVNAQLDSGAALGVMGTATQIAKILVNLISNALEAMPEGGTVGVTTGRETMHEAYNGYERIEPGTYVVLSVTDEGVALSRDEMSSIFEPFYTKKVLGRNGTGLGMAVVWGALKDHSGFVDIQSQMNHGTRFSIYLPHCPHITAEDETPAATDDVKGNGESILVVDDVEEQRIIAAGIMDALGYHVACVPSGEAALDYLKENVVDVVILDMVMAPGMDGLETYQKIIAIRPDQKTILASGYSDSERIQEALKAGAGRLIAKPYTLDAIGSAVKAELLG